MMEPISDSSHTGFYTRQIFLPHQFGVSDNLTNQGFSNLSEVWARGLLNLEIAFESSKLGKFDAV